MKPGSARDRFREIAASPTGSVDVSLMLYAVATAILAVSVGLLIAQAAQWGRLTSAISLSSALVLIVVAGFSADSVLNWLTSNDPSQDSPSRRP